MTMNGHDHRQPAMPLVGPIPPQAAPQPCPMSLEIGEARGPQGQRFIVMQIATAAGINFVFLSPEDAEKVADRLRQTASGIVPAAPSLAQMLADGAIKRGPQ